jgi:hypothetical protein
MLDGLLSTTYTIKIWGHLDNFLIGRELVLHMTSAGQVRLSPYLSFSYRQLGFMKRLRVYNVKSPKILAAN